MSQDIRVDRQIDVRLIPREDWDAAGVIVFTAAHPMSRDALDRIAEQGRWLAPGKQIIVMDPDLKMATRPGASDADASDAR